MAGAKNAAPGQHKATWARDKRNGGYMIRVEGPNANRFAGRTVPVTKRDGETSDEELEAVVWTGTDDDTGKPIALYTYKPREADLDDEIPF